MATGLFHQVVTMFKWACRALTCALLVSAGLASAWRTVTLYVFLALVGEGFGWVLDFVRSPIYEMMFYGGLSKVMWKFAYQTMGWLYGEPKWQFMNYGYADLTNLPSGKLTLGGLFPEDLGGGDFDLQDADERFMAQMYLNTATACHTQPKLLLGKKILEIGSGRGGGLGLCKRRLVGAKGSAGGGDLSVEQVKLCTAKNLLDDVSYIAGDAENLPDDARLAEGNFDAVLNVESSHCYPDIDKFYAEVLRMLKPGGHFLYADFREADGTENSMVNLEAKLKVLETDGKWKRVAEEDISKSALKSCELDAERRRKLITDNVHTILQGAMLHFAAAPGSEMYNGLEVGTTIYKCWAFQKSA